MKYYVVGFMFSDDFRYVLLLRKAKPAWQAGLLNGVGGKIEPDEEPVDAMRREFIEEVGYIGTCTWTHFAVLQGRREQEEGEFHVDCYWDKTPLTTLLLMPRMQCTMNTDVTEPVAIFRTYPDVCRGPSKLPVRAFSSAKVMPNLRWLVRLAIDSAAGGPAFTTAEYK